MLDYKTKVVYKLSKHNVIFGYQGAFELSREQEESFVRDFPECSFRFGPPDSYTSEELGAAEIMIGMFNPPQMQSATGLKWLQASTVGTDRYAGYVDTNKTLVTNSRDLFNKCMGEHSIAMILAYSRAICLQRDSQNKEEWLLHDVPADLFGSTIGVVGLGGIGGEVAKKAKAFDMRVLGIRRNTGNKPDYVDELYGMDRLEYLLEQSDFLVLAVPLTDETYHLISTEQFKKMKRNAYLLNVARGDVVDTDALISALQDGLIAGAGLDTVTPEPLPADHPLWGMPNVLITPHRANASPSTNHFRYNFYRENLRLYLSGQKLMNLAHDC